MSALEELLAGWRQTPDADRTIALCSHLGVSGKTEWIREVGDSAIAAQRNDGEVLLAVGRMFLDAGLLPEAQTALVHAGKAGQVNYHAFRYLGEVLLRRGDAVRAEKVLARALQYGAGTDEGGSLWADRAKVYVALQKRKGEQAVAREVARSHPHRPSIAPSSPSIVDVSDLLEEVTDSKVQARPEVPAPAPTRTTVESDPLPSFDLQSWSGVEEPPTNPGPVPVSGPQPMVVPAPAPGDAAVSAIPPPEVFPANSGPLAFANDSVAAPELVLEHLAKVGIFEREGGVAPAWEQAPPQKVRGLWVFILATVLVAGGGVGGYYYADQVKKERLAQAVQINEEVEDMLKGGLLSDLEATDEKLKQSFELDSLNERAARLWLENRVLFALIAPGEARGIDSANHRAKRVGLAPEQIAFGRVAAFYAEGDLAGAAALLPQWDKKAGKDAYYQLAAGAVLERAGDIRALERFERARALDPKLPLADLFLARLALLELDPKKARPVIDSFAKKTKDKAAVQVLEALLWAQGRDREKPPPTSLATLEQAESKLVSPLRPIRHLVAAVQAIDGGDYKEAIRAIDRGLRTTRTPAMATRFGFLAIHADNEALARKAALRALSFSAVYPGARVLAARVALLGGRLGEAQKAIEELDAESSDVAIVRAVVAYETLDISALESALAAFGEERTRPELEALVAGPGTLLGTDYPDEPVLQKIAQPHVPWGPLVAVDAALDSGQLEFAEEVMSDWPTDGGRPAHSLRQARLARYKGDREAALRFSEAALAAPTFAAVNERVLVLLFAGQVKAARSVVGAYPALLGPNAAWLSVLVDMADGREKQAKATASGKDFPPEATPVSLRLMAARALAVSGDKRAKDYVKLMRRLARKHPDSVALAELL